MFSRIYSYLFDICLCFFMYIRFCSMLPHVFSWLFMSINVFLCYLIFIQSFFMSSHVYSCLFCICSCCLMFTHAYSVFFILFFIISCFLISIIIFLCWLCFCKYHKPFIGASVYKGSTNFVERVWVKWVTHWVDDDHRRFRIRIHTLSCWMQPQTQSKTKPQMYPFNARISWTSPVPCGTS